MQCTNLPGQRCFQQVRTGNRSRARETGGGADPFSRASDNPERHSTLKVGVFRREKASVPGPFTVTRTVWRTGAGNSRIHLEHCSEH